jgi:hypothetical protein
VDATALSERTVREAERFLRDYRHMTSLGARRESALRLRAAIEAQVSPVPPGTISSMDVIATVCLLAAGNSASKRPGAGRRGPAPGRPGTRRGRDVAAGGELAGDPLLIGRGEPGQDGQAGAAPGQRQAVADLNRPAHRVHGALGAGDNHGPAAVADVEAGGLGRAGRQGLQPGLGQPGQVTAGIDQGGEADQARSDLVARPPGPVA